MSRSRPLAALLVALACVAPAAFAGPAEPARPYILRYATPYPPAHPFSRADIAWVKAVESASKGRLKVKVFWGGVLVGSDSAILELRHGVADIALVTPIYMRGGAQAIKLQAGFYANARTPDQQVAVYRCLQRDFPVLRDEMAGVRVLAVQGGNLPNLITRERPVRTLADFRGLRLRTPSEVAPLLRSLGADPVTMPMGEVYSALSKGVIDGVVAPADTIRSLHFSEVARYLSTLEVARGAYPSRAISERAWRRLPADLQKVLEDNQSVWEAALSEEVIKSEQAGIDFGRKTGIVTVNPAPAEQQRFSRLYNDMSLRIALRQAPDWGPAMFRRAQAAITEIRAGRPTGC